MNGLWSTFLGVALPLVGVDIGVLEAAGYALVPQTCGTISDWDREHSASFTFGYSDELFGEILILASTDDGTLVELFVIAGNRPFEGDPLRATNDQCIAPMPSVAIERNEIGLEVITELCPNGSGITMSSKNRSDPSSCRFAELLLPSQVLINSFMPRHRQ